MAGTSFGRSRQLKVIRVYLVTIIAVTVGLLVFGAVSFEQQRRTIRDLSVSTLQLMAQRVAFEFERRVWQLAEDFLRSPELVRFMRNTSNLSVKGGGPPLQSSVRSAMTLNPIAREVFLLRDGQLYLDRHPPAGRSDGAAGIDPSLAKELVRQLRDPGAAVSDRLYALAIRGSAAPWQTFYVRPAGDQPEILGFVLDMDWLNGQLLPACLSEVVEPESLSRSAGLRLIRDMQGADGLSGPETTIRFKTALPFWELHFPSASLDITKTAARREMWFVGISVLMIMSVLGLEIFLLLRISPELRLIQIQSEFVSRVSHELRTPLTLIRLYAETLMSDGRFTQEERHSYLQIITRESERLSRMINNILDFASSEQGQKQSDLRAGDLGLLLSRVLGVYESYLSQDGFTIRSDIAPNLPPVSFDSEEVTQAVVNIIDNARKYSGESRDVSVRLWSEKGGVIIEVEDHGMGIQPEDQERIFDPFYRTRDAGRKDGWGLGLYLVRHVMDRHKGRVEVESRVGQGSRFRLIFPAMKTRREAHRTT